MLKQLWPHFGQVLGKFGLLCILPSGHTVPNAVERQSDGDPLLAGGRAHKHWRPHKRHWVRGGDIGKN